MKFLDLFSGIGGFRLGMEQAGHKCVGWVEWDKFARKSYQAIFEIKGGGTPMIYDQLDLMKFLEPTAGASDFRAKISQWPEDNKESPMENVVPYFLQLRNLLGTHRKKVDPVIYSLRTLKTYLVLTQGLTSSNFKLSWMKSGTMSNGMFSTAPKSSLSTGSVFSLSDILEDEVPEKYFLSAKIVKKLLKQTDHQLIPLQHDIQKPRETDRTLLKVNRRKSIK